VGVYNPHIPQILGQEFCPIREEGITFSPSVNVVELGHTFSLATPKSVTDVRFYIKELPPGWAGNQVYTASVYPAGLESKTGPINSCIIPCNALEITGAAGAFFGTLTPDSLQSPGDGFYIQVEPGFDANRKSIDLYFATNSYAQLLMGKRIVGVNMIYQLTIDPTPNGTNLIPATIDAPAYINSQLLQFSTGSSPGNELALNYAPSVFDTQNALWYLNPTIGGPGAVTQLNKLELGDINNLWNTPSVTRTIDKMPWRYQELQRFEQSSGVNRTRIHFEFGSTVNNEWGGFWFLGYAALEVLYCEEQRVAYGGTSFGRNQGGAGFAVDYIQGVNIIALHDPSTLAASPTLPAGQYSVVIASADIGDLEGPFATDERTRPSDSNTYPTLNALRELYTLSSHVGVQVNVTHTEGEVFTDQPTLILPQVTMHASSGPLPEVHVYGTQAVAQVYGSITATQEIYDAGLTSASYPQVRFYARRFGSTVVPLTLSSPTISGSGQSVSITPAQWDLLEPIVDGWKEVTLRFPTPPAMGTGTNPQWIWSSTGELKGNRWEVLGAVAPAVSGVTGNWFNRVPSPNQLSAATYGAPVSGAGINMGWIPQYAPPVSATVDDQTTDAVLMFSQDSPTISGFGIVQLNQAVSGIGQNCGINPAFIPSQIAYNQLSWSLDQNSIASDLFSRVVASGWGTATSGQAWTASGGSATDFSVNGSTGNVLLSTAGVYRLVRLATFNLQNVNGYVEISSNTAALTLDHWGALAVRDVAGDEWYGQIKFNPSGTVQLLLSTVTTAVHTNLATVTIAQTYTLNTKVKLRIQATGSEFRGKAWMDGEVEPADWQLRVATSANNNVGAVLTRTISGVGTPLTTVVSYDNLLVSSISNGYTELQRLDSLTDWKTIMKAYRQDVASYNDYEARVGLSSSYRVRYVNVYGFAGPWSATVSNTIAAPGVTATSVGANDHVWIFTTNSIQAGTSNLAYCLGWENEVNEEFNFPEASGQTFQTMYNRDFVTVFRPSERGGTNFGRNLLVQAAAISPETLEDFTSLRNMAWVDVPYICLRDEDGNRWFANVSVPGASVRRDRRLYMAPVTIVEVTETPTPVDP
jgi:hypothetical protein